MSHERHVAARPGALDVATGAVGAVLVFAAVPAVLVALVGLPFPHLWDGAAIVSSGTLFDLLALVAWVSWTCCCWSLLRSVGSRVRGRDAVAGGTERLPEWLAARMAAAVLAVAPVSVLIGAAAGASARRPSAAVAATLQAGPRGTADSDALPPPSGTASTPVAAKTAYTVQAGDSLWSIAERFYGDGAEWSTIAQANLGQLMDDGSRFTDPNLIVTGWVLTVPDPAGGDVGGGAPGSPAPAGPTIAPVPTPPRASRQPDRAPRSGRGFGAIAPRHSLRSGRRGAPTPPGVPLPELVALGVGTLVAAALARRSRRNRLLASLSRHEGIAPVDVSEHAADTAALLDPFDGAPVLGLLESANRHLACALADMDGRSEAPKARWVRVGPDGVDVRVAESVTSAPPGWQCREGHTWHLPAGTDPTILAARAAGHGPWLPVLVPVGDNEDGTWLVPVAPGSCLPVLGPSAGALLTAMRLAVESWPWSEDLVVSDDAAAVESSANGGPPPPSGGPPPVPGEAQRTGAAPVLFFGDPGDLSPAARSRCGVVTASPVHPSDLIVVVDERAASLHPLGVTLHPQAVEGPRGRAIEELVTPSRPDDGAEIPRAGPVGAPGNGPTAHFGNGQTGSASPMRRDVGHAPSTAWADLLVPGQVEVRLLTTVPRMDGLMEDLTPKRARRATEVVAYLALHHPDPVTGDRLRTRVLGSADADAAAKTLFNTAGAARRAMGRDAHGEQLLPPATKAGHYRVSPLVTVDAVRASGLVAAAGATEDEEEAIALLRAALGLVEGEPLAGMLTGYAWWSAEGHEGRLAATMVDGACQLARLAVRHGHVELARWGIEQARVVEHYSEALSRTAMLLAAEVDDADRLRREWADCRRRVDELEPGGLPSETTERLYDELRRRLPSEETVDEPLQDPPGEGDA